MDLGGSPGAGLCRLPALPENQRMHLLGWCRCWAVLSQPGAAHSGASASGAGAALADLRFVLACCLLLWKGFLRDAASLFPFLTGRSKLETNLPCTGRLREAPWQVCRPAPWFPCLSRPPWAGWRWISLLEKGKEAPFSLHTKKAPSKEQSKPVAGVGAPPLINLLVSAMFRVWKSFYMLQGGSVKFSDGVFHWILDIPNGWI